MMDKEIYFLCRMMIAFEERYPMSIDNLEYSIDYMKRAYFETLETHCDDRYPRIIFIKKIMFYRFLTTTLSNWNMSNGLRRDERNKFDTYLYKKYQELYKKRLKK